MNWLFIPIVYTMIDYWNLPIWLFAVYATLWVVLFICAVYLEIKAEKINL